MHIDGVRTPARRLDAVPTVYTRTFALAAKYVGGEKQRARLLKTRPSYMKLSLVR
jgi:hypothetical protein